MPDFVHLSLLAELSISVILIFIWALQRQEKHALLWGLAQIARASTVLYWLHSASLFGSPPHTAILMIGLCLFISAFWNGTRYFIGQPFARWPHYAWIAAFVWGFFLVREWNQPAGLMFGLCAIGITFIWSGLQIIKQGNHYHLLGWVLIYRGFNNMLTFVVVNSPVWLERASMLAFFMIVLSTFGLLYAVLHESMQRYRATLSSLKDGVLVIDKQGVILQANHASSTLFQLDSSNAVLGKNLFTLLPNFTQEGLNQLLCDLRAPNTQFPLIWEYALSRGDRHESKPLAIELSAAPYHERGHLHVMLQIRDISERKLHEHLLEHTATIDEVCGLPNRHALNRYLSKITTEALTSQREHALLFIDLDHFKRVNDSLGHEIGDLLLRQAGSRLHLCAAQADLVARFGGDEFVIMDSCDSRQRVLTRAEQLGADILHAFSTPFQLQHLSLVVTPSIGIAITRSSEIDTQHLLKQADIAMYAAKHSGRNNACIFNDSMNLASQSALQIDNALRQAIDRKELFLVYQPIIDTQSLRLEKFEVLVRWHHPTFGMIPPDKFIPIAEESGQIVGIGNWILQEACRELASWQGSALGQLCISVNISAWQLADSSFISFVQQTLQDFQLTPKQLELELTERVLIDEDETTNQALQQLQAMGISLSLDDFGTGYSSLNYLTRIHLNTLKIDRSFIHDIGNNARSRHLTQAIIAMGKSLDIHLIAEGVETEEQANIVRELGCYSQQGYFFAKPARAGELAMTCQNFITPTAAIEPDVLA